MAGKAWLPLPLTDHLAALRKHLQEPYTTVNRSGVASPQSHGPAAAWELLSPTVCCDVLVSLCYEKATLWSE